MRNLILILLLFLATTAFAQQDDVLLSATHDKLNEVVRQALAADPRTLNDWAKDLERLGEIKNEFCPEYEKKYLSEFLSALATSKSVTGASALQARAHAVLNVYALASFRPASVQDLKQLLLSAREAALAAQATGAPTGSGKNEVTVGQIDGKIATLDLKAPNRVRISEPSADCYSIAKPLPIPPSVNPGVRAPTDVVLVIVVGRDGRVLQTRPVRGEPSLAAATAQAVKAWTYRPYYLLGQPVEFEARVTVRIRP